MKVYLLKHKQQILGVYKDLNVLIREANEMGLKSFLYGEFILNEETVEETK